MASEGSEIVEKNILIDGSEDELKMITPFACFVAGCTGSGKSVTVLKWILNAEKVFKTKFTEIFYFYGSVYQDALFGDESLKHVHFSDDMCLLDKIIQHKHEPPGILVILDDLMNDTANSPLILDLYTKGSHHRNISVINIVQNIFYKSPHFVTLKENTQYYYIKQFINESKVKTLANHIGLNSEELHTAYTESISNDRYEGILVDNHISSNIRKIAKIRDKITSSVPGLYITDQKFKSYLRKKVLKKVDDNNYLLELDMLKDKVRRDDIGCGDHT